jgi:hypothetical protein
MTSSHGDGNRGGTSPPPATTTRTAAFLVACLVLPSSLVASFAPPRPNHPATYPPPAMTRTMTTRRIPLPPLVASAVVSSSALMMSVEGDFDPISIAKSKRDIESGSLRARFRSIYKFARPHTIRGTILASISGTARALLDSKTTGMTARASLMALDWYKLFPHALLGMIALLLGNAYIVGINQIYDRDIDVLNKPYLPIASGEMSIKFAWLAVAFSGIVGPAIV